jgi:hypothetical protein
MTDTKKNQILRTLLRLNALTDFSLHIVTHPSQSQPTLYNHQSTQPPLLFLFLPFSG